jgi:flagellar biosynthesis/type III secretory pathway M-ring protein FliF/YscJ
MAEQLGFALGVVLVVGVFVFAALRGIRRRAAMTPEQRQLEDQAREIRKLKKEQARQRYD